MAKKQPKLTFPLYAVCLSEAVTAGDVLAGLDGTPPTDNVPATLSLWTNEELAQRWASALDPACEAITLNSPDLIVQCHDNGISHARFNQAGGKSEWIIDLETLLKELGES